MVHAALWVLAILTCSFGQILVSYEDYARTHGWPVGELMTASWIRLLGAAVYLVALGRAFMAIAWWAPLVVAVTAFIVAFLVLGVFRSWVQAVAFLGSILCMVGTLLVQ